MEELLNKLSEATNRSKSQTKFLFQLVDSDYNALVRLEEQLHNYFVTYCPRNKNECQRFLDMPKKAGWLNLSHLKPQNNGHFTSTNPSVPTNASGVPPR